MVSEEYRKKIDEWIEAGIIDIGWLGEALLNWISTDELVRFCDKHCLFDDLEDDDGEETEA